MITISKENWESGNLYYRLPSDYWDFLGLRKNDTTGNLEASTASREEVLLHIRFMVKTVPTHYIERRLEAIE